MTRALTAMLASLFSVGLLAWTTHVRADQPLDVAAELRGVPLGARVSLLEDPRGVLAIEDVAERADFHAHAGQTVSLGFTSSVYWLRVVVANSAEVERSWLLEVAFPHLDDLTLYVPRADGGFEARATGDSRPFAQRDLAYRNFVFMLQQPPGQPRAYYLRVRTVGSMSVPLVAWTLGEFVEHQHLEWAGLCIFYGVILAMACYTACLALFTRQREYLYFSLAVLSMGLFQLAYVGHAFQYLFPTHPALAQQSTVISVGINMYFMANLAHHQLVSEASERMRRLHTAWMRTWIAIATLAAFLPFALALKLMTISCVLVNVVMAVLIVTRVRARTRELRVYFLGWGAMCLGALVLALKSAHVLPENLFTNWSVQIGASAMFVLVASAMASRLTALRSEVGELNVKLGHKVTALENAVQRAEQASALAERAARVKDEFIATMSHELRTPLNTIINVPEGLVEDFPVEPRACCSACLAEFELDANERIELGATCPECGSAALSLRERAHYVGDPERTVRYLDKIERSGTHLLHVIEGMLRADQAQSAEVPLQLDEVELTRLVREVVDEMSDLSARAGVSLTLIPAEGELALAADPLRVRQVLINLIGNAIKFSAGRGAVRVRLSAEGDSCVCAVEDDGIGIAPDKLETVFTSYRQADADVRRVYGGTGLGLTIARSLIRLHGGELWVESALGKGSVFRFRLPRAAPSRLTA